MSILMWDKPAKKLQTAAWKESYSFEDGPHGGYIPNMSEADEQRWKAKITGTKLGFPQVEIRKSAGASQMLIIVNLGAGYNYKQYRAIDPKYEHMTRVEFDKEFPSLKDDYTDAEIRQMGHPTEGINVHISLNGPAQLTFSEMSQMHDAIEEAKVALEAL